MHDLVTRIDVAPELRLVPYAFGEAYGHPPAGVWTAPYAVRLPGLVASLAWQVLVAAAPRTDGVLRLGSLNRPADSLEVKLPGDSAPAWAAPALAVARSLDGGADILVNADLPPTTGLPVTPALECVVALALSELHGLPTGRERLAEVTRRAAPGGDDLRAAVLYGSPGHVLALGEGGPPRLIPVELSTAVLLLMVTRPPTPGEELEPLLRRGDLTAAGRLLTQPSMVAAAAVAGGAYGAWPLDLGGGALALVPSEAVRLVRASVTQACRERGLRAPRFLPTTLGGSVRRVA